MASLYRAWLHILVAVIVLAAAPTAWSSDEEQHKFFVAINGGNLPLVRQYLQKGFSANSAGAFGIPALYLAQMGNNPTVLDELIRNGADLNVRFGPTQRSALHDAALGGRIECVRILLAAGADPNIHNKFGRTPLGLVSSPPLPLKSPHNASEIAALLRQYGGN